MSLRYAEHVRADETTLLRLYNETYPNLDWTPPYLHWQYYENPAGAARNWVAWDGDRIVGNVTAIPHRLTVMGEAALGWRVQDVMTRPEYRGQGVFSKLLALANAAIQTAGHPLNFTFPNENSFPFFEKSGWVACEKIPLWEITLVGKGGAELDRLVNVRPLTQFDAAIGEIWTMFRRGVTAAIDRTPAYLNWRYVANPRTGFFPVLLTRDANSHAVLILKVFDKEDGTRIAHVCDLFASGSGLGAGEALELAKTVAAAAGAKQLTAWHSSEGPFAAAFKTAGFSLHRSATRNLVRKVNDPQLDAAKLYATGGWNLAMGDSDVY